MTQYARLPHQPIWHEVDYTGVDFEAASLPYHPTVCGVDVDRHYQNKPRPVMDIRATPPKKFCLDCKARRRKRL